PWRVRGTSRRSRPSRHFRRSTATSGTCSRARCCGATHKPGADKNVARVRLIGLQVIVGLLAIALWQIGTTVPVGGDYLLPPFFFSTPADVAARVVKWFVEGTVWRHLWITLYEAMMAFIIGSAAGVVIGFWFARQPMVAAVLDPYVKMINALPRVVLAPIFALWFGLGPASKIALAIPLLFFLLFFNFYLCIP